MKKRVKLSSSTPSELPQVGKSLSHLKNQPLSRSKKSDRNLHEVKRGILKRLGDRIAADAQA